MSEPVIRKGSNFVCKNCNAILLEAEKDITKIAPIEPERAVVLVHAKIQHGLVICRACGKKAHYIHDAKNWHRKIGGKK